MNENKMQSKNMQEWSIFINSEQLNLFQKFEGEIRFGPEFIQLKSEPAIPELNSKIFGNWFYRVDNGIFLQEWNSLQTPDCSLIYINFENYKYLVIDDNIKSVFWDMKEDNDYFYLNLNYNHFELKINKDLTKKS